MHAILAIVLAVFVSFGLAASTQAQPGGKAEACLPLAVATAPQTPGQPLTANEIVLISIEGAEVARAEFEEPLQVFPTTYPARSVVRSLGGDFGILATNDDGSPAGMVMTLTEFENSSAIQYGGFGFEVPDGSRFGLFHDAATLSAFLVDLDSGSTLPLSEFIDESDRIVGAEVAQGDEWLAVWTGRDIVLFDLAGGTTETLGSGDALGSPSFSDDGKTLYFLRRGSDDQSLIASRDVAIGGETSLANHGEWFGLQHFPGDVLVAQTPGALQHIPTDGSGAIRLLESNAELRPRMIDPDGKHLLVETSTPNADAWVLADLSGSGATELPGLTGLSLTNLDEQAAWALLLPHLGPKQGEAGAPYVSLDLETGATQTALEQGGGNGIYFADSPGSDDGRFAVIWSLSPAFGRLWLIDNEFGSSELIAESTGGAVGALTSDGCYLAVGIFDTVGEGRQGIVQIIDLETRQVTAEIADAILLGWART